MATENGWRARRIQAELSKLGIHLGLTTIARYLPKVDGSGGDPHQRRSFRRTFPARSRDSESISSEPHCKVRGRTGPQNASRVRFVESSSITWSSWASPKRSR